MREERAKLYVDHMSQPSRACMVLCRTLALPVDEVLVNILKGGTHAPAYAAVNPLRKVPALVEADGFRLPESHAIMRYLCDARGGGGGGGGAALYPRAPRARAAVDAALGWHSGTLRPAAGAAVWHRVIAGNLGLAGDQALVDAHSLPALREALAALEAVWLDGGRRDWVAGGADASIADLALACEVEQLQLLDGAARGPTGAELLDAAPAVRGWLARVARRCAPHYDDAHAVVRKVRARMVAAKDGPKSSL